MSKIFLFIVALFSIEDIYAQVFKHKYLDMSAEFIQSGMLKPYEVLHIHIENKSRKKVILWLPRWSMIALDTKNPLTVIQPANSQTLNYLYLGFGTDTKRSIHGNILPNFVHLEYTGLEGNKGIVKMLLPKETFDIHFLINDSLSLKTLKKTHPSLVLFMKISNDKKFFNEYITDPKVFYPFQSYYIKDAFFFHKDTYAPFSFVYQPGEYNTEIFPIDLYEWFYYDSNYVIIKRK